MAMVAERMSLDFERLQGLGIAAILVAPVDGSFAFPRVVYDDFVWHCFWRPVQADANLAVCTTHTGGVTQYLDTVSAYTAAAEPVVYPDYTLVSEVGCMVTLVIAFSGVVFLLRRLDIGERPRFFYALFPFMLLGSAFRVVESANDAPSVADALITYPLGTLVISSAIYVTVFAITFVAVVGSALVERRDLVDDYVKPLFEADLAVPAVTLGCLLWAGLTGAQGVTFYPQVLVVILVGATLAAATTWQLIERFAPEVNRGTGYVDLVVIWGHAIDNVANVIGLDWVTNLDARYNLVLEHPVNQTIVDSISSMLPESVLAVMDNAQPLLLTKPMATTAVVWVFDGQTFEDSSRYTILLLIAILTIGLGPGSHDMLRATFSI